MAPQLWPIFICYRRVDGAAVARRLHEMLDKWQTTGPDDVPVQLDVYLDETMPGVADWQELHKPYLQKARALLVVCTPGAKINEGPKDWVHREVDWWVAHRRQAPILIDALKEGIRYVPDQIALRWPEIQRIAFVEEEWKALSGAALDEKTKAIRRQVIGALLPSGAAVYAQELEVERKRAQGLKRALVASATLLVATAAAGGYAYLKRRAAERSERTAGASLLDARAASLFAQSRLIDARYQAEALRRNDLLARIAATKTEGVRLENLQQELAQVNVDLRRLRTEAAGVRSRGRALLDDADARWKVLGDAGRGRPEPPHVLSVELINAGPGESILIHYGTPDEVRLVMINGGPRPSYPAFVEPRLRELKEGRYDGRPVPIELFVVGDRDADKIEGLLKMLEHLRETPQPTERLIELKGIWANLFRVDHARGLRENVRTLIDELRVPLNEPFDHLVMRPDEGRAAVTLPGGLEIVVLGPQREKVHDLYEYSRKEAKRKNGVIEEWQDETFSKIAIVRDSAPLAPPATQRPSVGDCRPSENARARAGGHYIDRSVANLASTIVLLRYRGKTFLHTGDARGDQIFEGLQAARLLDADGRAHVDMMSIPHSGSDRNITVDFFERVRADGYLFSGDGRHGNPEITTVAALITARGCDAYRMYFVNRDGAEDAHGKKLDAFFKDEAQFNPNYRRVFRSEERGSVMIDLLEPVRY